MDRSTCYDLPMRCITWESGILTPGLRVSGSGDKGHYCLLGDPSTPGPCSRIPFHNTNPPHVVDGRVYEVFPFWVRPKDASNFLVLAQPHEKHLDDDRFLVRISTYNEETFGGRGFWRAVEGSTNTIATGITYYTDSQGRKAVASHGLVILNPGQTLRVRPEGSDTHWAVRWDDGMLHTMPWEQYQAALYMEAVR